MTAHSMPDQPAARPARPPISRLHRWLRAIVSTLVVATAGILLHYAYEWSGGSRIVALFAAVNESTWEHLKLAFWPALLLTPVQRRLYGPLPGWPAATATRCLLPSVLIVCGFYGYTAVVGKHDLAADIGLFVVAIFLGESAGHLLLDRPASPPGSRRCHRRSRAGDAGVLHLHLVSPQSVPLRRPPRRGGTFRPADIRRPAPIAPTTIVRSLDQPRLTGHRRLSTPSPIRLPLPILC